VTCGDFHDGSKKGKASVHQILCQSWEMFLTKNKMAVIPIPPYSLDLAPCDFFLFQKNEIEAERTPV
jgi:hypothetical protein